MDKSKEILIINNEKHVDEPGWIPHIKNALTAIDNFYLTIIHHSKVTYQVIDDLQPECIILTGRVEHHWEDGEIERDYVPRLSILKDFDIPILGICAGLQIIASMFGGETGRMVEGNEDVLEEGYTKLTILKDDPIFKGLDQTFYCKQAHRDEVKVLPEDFDHLASSDMCEIQAMKHKNRPIYGVQFHPEWYTKELRDGRAILENFLRFTP
jgi:GMP synthase (glutamine-hydrolysing) A subunit